MKNGIIVKCEICEKEFYINPGRIKNNHHTCSVECRGKLSSLLYSKKVQVKCEICEKDIYYKPHKFSEIKHYTCSIECRAKLMSTIYKGRGNPRFNNLTKLESFFRERCINLKRRADIKKLEFDLTYQDLIDIYEKQEKTCYYTKLPFSIFGKKNYNTLSVDRLDSKKGYTKDNVVLALLCVNMFKSNYALEDMEDVFRAIDVCYIYETKSKVKKLNEDSELPYRKNKSDVGYDIFVHHVEDCGNYIKVFSGIAVQPDKGFYFELVSRSSTYKKGLELYNGVGIIDNEYTGEIISIFYKTKDFKELPKKGERLCQLILRKQYHAVFQSVDNLDNTERGEGGFGSTNVGG